MATLEELLANQLLGRKEELAAQNPWLLAADAIGKINLGDYDLGNGWGGAKGAFLQNLANSFSRSMGLSDVDRQYDRLSGRLAKVYSGGESIDSLEADPETRQFAGLARLLEDRRAAESGIRIKELQQQAALRTPFLARRFPDLFGLTSNTLPNGAPRIAIDADIPQDPDTQAALDNALSTIQGEMQASGGNSYEDELIDLMGMGLSPNRASEVLEQRSGSAAAKYPSMQPLLPEQQLALGQQLNIPSEQIPFRLRTQKDADRELAIAKFKGEALRPPASQEISRVVDLKNSMNLLEDAFSLGIGDPETNTPGISENQNTYLANAGKAPYSGRGGAVLGRVPILGGIISELRADTSSPDYKFDQLLTVAQKAFAKAAEGGGRLTDWDVKMFDGLVKGVEIADSKNAKLERLRTLFDFTKKKLNTEIQTLKEGQVNIGGFTGGDRILSDIPRETGTPTGAIGMNSESPGSASPLQNQQISTSEDVQAALMERAKQIVAERMAKR